MGTNTAYTLSDNDIKQDSPAVAAGKVVYDGTAIVATDVTEIVTGFKPTKVTWLNATDRIEGAWMAGMGDGACVKRAATGAGTLEATGITVTDRGFTVSQNATLALILANKTCYFRAEG